MNKIKRFDLIEGYGSGRYKIECFDGDFIYYDDFEIVINKYKSKLKEMFDILDAREVSDSGKEFSPVYFSSCRILLTQKFSSILKELKELSK